MASLQNLFHQNISRSFEGGETALVIHALGIQVGENPLTVQRHCWQPSHAVHTVQPEISGKIQLLHSG